MQAGFVLRSFVSSCCYRYLLSRVFYGWMDQDLSFDSLSIALGAVLLLTGFVGYSML